VKPLSSFCASYIDNRWVEFPNVKWIREWVSRHLQHTNTRFVRDSMYNAWDGEWQYGLDGDELVTNLEVGNNLLSMLKKEIVNVQSYGLCVAPNLYIG
jgi:hypothetical protein